MAILELNIKLTEQQRATCELVRKFTTEMVRSAGVKLDRLHDPADVIAQGSPLHDVFRKYRELGLHKASLPAAVGGLEQDALTGALIHEQLGWGDGGVGYCANRFYISLPFCHAIARRRGSKFDAPVL